MELRHLRYFIAVAEELHFGRAALRLNISQPPLSQQIIQLEKELGIKLFARTNRSVKLTKAGRFFQQEAYTILSKIENSVEEARKIHSGASGSLKIAFTGSLNSELVRLIQSHRLCHPDVTITLLPMSSSAQLKALLDKDIHIGFLCPPITNPEINSRHVYSARFVAALPKDHLLAAEDGPIEIRQLKNDPFIMAPRRLEPGYYDTIISICLHGGMTPLIHQEAEGVPHILSLVSAGLGVSLVTAFAQQEYPKSNIVYKELVDTYQEMSLHVAWNQTVLDSLAQAFIETIGQET